MAYTTIKKPSDYFNTKLYTGNGSSGHAITGVGFRPDFNWIKNRGAANSHIIHDVLRGVGYELQSNTTAAQGTADPFTSFDSDGFTLGGGGGGINGNSETYVSWNWLANGAGSANTDGSISSTVSASTTSGFSIVKYTGTGSAGTVGHGLGSTPKMIIVKTISASGNYWTIYHQAMGNTNYIFFNTNGTASTADTWNDTSPTSSVFHLGTDGDVNTNGATLIAYCFAEKQGYSKFGSYTGNGNADGTFIYTGFKPAVFIVKKTSGTANWEIRDNKRTNSFNTQDERLFPNLSNAGSSSEGIDFISNGLKLRGTSSNWNDSGGTYIYMAFAEEPLVGDNPATAR